ncbi:hypothetical protein [Desertivirga brevis]|uniref:hypothetical protein n=1 Tax=Desertivirga brevis TaxID=2810310 RepID=UPI001A95D2F2|nr:hypothetical protein [Pedobacter sp. SYSU D00873]
MNKIISITIMKNGFSLLLVCLLLPFYALAQKFDSTSITHKFNTYLKNTLQEKIYVHTDKSSYMSGEIIWFKIYNVEAYTNRPISYNKVAYVEVLDEQNTAVLQTKVDLSHGSGSLYIPITIATGAYTLRCYTSWMKNFDPSFYFYKDLAIYNSLTKEEAPGTAVRKKYAVQFFPEGGNLVLGLKSKVGFKAVDSEGNTFHFRGCIVNPSGDTVARFSPSDDGIGTFYFRPEQIQDYHVLIAPVNENPFSVQLPRIFERGAVMSTTFGADSILNISVQSNLESEGSYTLFVHTGYHTVFTRTLSSKSIAEGFKVPYKDLGEGISHLTLFNNAQQALCERLYFKKPLKLASVEVLTDKKNYSSREQVKVSVRETVRGKALKTSFSISVFKVDSIATPYDDISTYLLLSSELKGRIPQVSSYLKEYSEEKMDHLMLTHGWRRFKWEDIIQEKKPDLKFFSEPQGHIISGRILEKETNRPLADRNVFLSIPGQRIQFYTAYADKSGEFNFLTKDFSDSPLGIVVQTEPRIDSLARIEIRGPFSSNHSDYKPAKFNFKTSVEDLLQRSVAMQVNNAFNGRLLNNRIPRTIDSTSFYQQPEKIYKLDNYVRFKTMEEVLREYVSEINVAVRKKDYYLSVFDKERNEFHSSSPLILVDGVPVFDDGTTLIKIDPLKVKQLEVVSNGYIYGNNRFSGIASFRTFKGDLGGLALPTHATVIDYEGVQEKRVFYSPMYDGDWITSSRIPDYRTTLFWNGTNETSQEGTATVNFSTSDLTGKYHVVVQSLSEEGFSGSQVAEFEVYSKNTAMRNGK